MRFIVLVLVLEDADQHSARNAQPITFEPYFLAIIPWIFSDSWLMLNGF
jgi:hypothetical protein